MLQLISISAAKAAGLKFYFTGKPCKHGGVAERAVTTGRCICPTCRADRVKEQQAIYAAKRDEKLVYARAKSAEYRAQHKTEVLAKKREYHTKNRDVLLGKQRLRRELNIDAELERNRIYRKANRGICNAAGHRYRARQFNASPAWNKELDDFVMLEAARLCLLRNAATGIVWQVDHMIPLQADEACGLHVAQNLQVIPQRMNAAKSNRMVLTEPGEWIK